MSNVSAMPAIARLPLGAVRAFEAASRLGSLKAAAAELGVTPAAVSHQVKALEAHIGASLFDRLHRELRLTIVGRRFATAATAAMSGLDQALDDLVSEGLIAGAITLNVTAAPTFAAKWLAPRLHLFQSAHPGIELRLRADETLIDPARDRRMDIAIRYGTGPYASELAAERLWPHDVVVAVCTPEVAGGVACAADLANVRLLRTAMPPTREAIASIGWEAWFSAAGVPDSLTKRAIATAPRFSTTHLSLEAAAAGQGVALSPRVLVADELATGRLVTLFEVELSDPFAFWLLFRRDRGHEMRIRNFVRWIRDLV